MKKIILIICFSLFAFTVKAQHVFEKGDLMFNAGLGLFSYDGFVPSIFISGEYGSIPTGDIGVVSFGGIMAYKYSTYNWGIYSYDDNYHQFVIGPRGIWHLHVFESDKWDAYGGAGFGVRIHSEYEWDGSDIVRKGKVSPYGELFVGGRMMIKENFGLMAEMGYGTLSVIKFGVTLTL